MAALQSAQFRGKKSKDPFPKNDTPTFGAGQGSKTMKVERPKGLKKGISKHPHRDHAGSRSKRAVPNKKK